MEEKFLYHYTTIEALAMILSTRNIKFNPLSGLDDPQEEKVKDTQKFGDYVFISSWTV